MIIIALGANLPSRFGEADATLQAAAKRMTDEGLKVIAGSSIWKTAPVPISDQPWYKNAIVAVETDLTPDALLKLLNKIEDNFGRVRTVRNAPRLLDLDIIAYNDVVLDDPDLTIPHPRMHDRAFVLHPMAEIAPNWHHPTLKKSLTELIQAIPETQEIEITPHKVLPK